MRQRTLIAAALTALIALSSAAAAAQTSAGDDAELAPPSVFDAPQPPGSLVTASSASHSPYAPLYGSAAHWSAAPPPSWHGPSDAGGAVAARRWYGWQTLAFDGAAIGALALATAAHSEALAAVGLLSYALASPAVHVGHHRPLIALASVGLRIGMPAAGAIITTADDCSGELCRLEALAAGMLVGAAGAIAIDAGVLSWDRLESQEPHRSIGLLPTVEIGRERNVVGVQGIF
jgi:hypothetical protein